VKNESKVKIHVSFTRTIIFKKIVRIKKSKKEYKFTNPHLTLWVQQLMMKKLKLIKLEISIKPRKKTHEQKASFKLFRLHQLKLKQIFSI
jgi:hypothetical protein